MLARTRNPTWWTRGRPRTTATPLGPRNNRSCRWSVSTTPRASPGPTDRRTCGAETTIIASSALFACYSTEKCKCVENEPTAEITARTFYTGNRVLGVEKKKKYRRIRFVRAPLSEYDVFVTRPTRPDQKNSLRKRFAPYRKFRFKTNGKSNCDGNKKKNRLTQPHEQNIYLFFCRYSFVFVHDVFSTYFKLVFFLSMPFKHLQSDSNVCTLHSNECERPPP